MSILEFGPYKRKDSRWIVVLYDQETDTTTSVSYPRWLMEKHLGHKLGKSEEVHHVDGNVDNNSLSNLEVLTHEKHLKAHRRIKPEGKPCNVCGGLTTRLKYCSPKCSSLGSRKVDRPPKETLEIEMGEHSMVALGRKYGVSDNAVRKWAKSYGII